MLGFYFGKKRLGAAGSGVFDAIDTFWPWKQNLYRSVGGAFLMKRHLRGPWSAGLCAAFFFLCGQTSVRADDAPTTQPAVRVETGELDFTFTQRSPLSAPKELGRRLNLKKADTRADYDLSKCPFKAYVPRNYDPAKPVGVIVYLGYKDTVSSPPLWQPVLEESHLIFISPVCHSGEQYLPSVPPWQTMGLALDAVYNLKLKYAIDDKRIYQMSWNDQSTPMALATADVFRGFIIALDLGWYSQVRADNNRFYPATFAMPPVALLWQARSHPFVLIDDKSSETAKVSALKAAAMKGDGFDHVTQIGLSLMDDLHFPNLTAEWLSQQALPFLDKVAATEPQLGAVNSASTQAATVPSDSKSSSDAQALLSRAQLLLSNGRTDLARDKLQQIVQLFPNDPAAVKAKQLLQQIGNQ
jgi:hypothetical protein